MVFPVPVVGAHTRPIPGPPRTRPIRRVPGTGAAAAREDAEAAPLPLRRRRAKSIAPAKQDSPAARSAGRLQPRGAGGRFPGVCFPGRGENRSVFLGGKPDVLSPGTAGVACPACADAQEEAQPPRRQAEAGGCRSRCGRRCRRRIRVPSSRFGLRRRHCGLGDPTCTAPLYSATVHCINLLRTYSTYICTYVLSTC